VNKTATGGGSSMSALDFGLSTNFPSTSYDEVVFIGGILSVTYIGPATGTYGYIETVQNVSYLDNLQQEFATSERAVTRHYFRSSGDTA